MIIRAAVLTAALSLLPLAAASAGPIADAALKAETLFAEESADQAVEALQEAVAAAWQQSPLVIRKSLLVDSSSGLGIYEPRLEAPFAPGDKVQIYVEPWGFNYGRQGELNTIDLRVGLGVENATGQVLAEKEDLFSLSAKTHDRYRDFSLSLSFVMPQLKSGDYIGIFTVEDLNSEKTGRFRIAFTIEAPVAEQAPVETSPN